MAPAASTFLTELLQSVDEELLHPDAGDFVGRDFVHDEIAQFLSAKNRMFVIVGSPGVGKTALAAALVRERLACEHPYLAHFCGLSGADNPFAFCSAIAQQLYDQLGEGYTLPQTARNQQVTIQASANVGQASGDTSIKVLTLNVGGMHPREAFRQLVREPLRVYDAQHGAERGKTPLIIVLDGLDRAWDWDGGQDGNIVSVLADAQDLPPWVNLICTARPGPAVQALRAQTGVRVIDLHGDANLKDIATFLQEHFLDALPVPARASFDQHLASSGIDAANDGEQTQAFIRQAVDASQGSFLFVRRYVDAWRAALQPSVGQPAVDPASLLKFENGRLVGMDRALDSTYAAILADLRRDVNTSEDDADQDVLAALALAFAPLNLSLLTCIAQQPADKIQQSLDLRLKPVIEQRGGSANGADTAAPTYALYHRGFAEYVRLHYLRKQGRDLDVRAATALEQTSDDDALLRAYSAQFRWPHLLRGLDLAAAARDASELQDTSLALKPAQTSAANLTPIDSIAQIQAQVRDPVIQAQLLRGLAARGLDPAQSEATGSWTAALNCLRSAEYTLRHSRALTYTRRRDWRADHGGPITDELLELERTLIAMGDAYSKIAQRMDGSEQRPQRPTGLFGWLHALWDSLAHFPLTLYLLMVLLTQGVSEIHIPGALQNLGRDQDWTVARLYVLGVSAYRRARSLARARGADDSADEIAERLARLYANMGAYDAALAAYETLLARPTAITRAWRQAIWRLELGEVLIAQHSADQAIEVLTSALPVFVAQQAPVQQARTLSALAAAYQLRAAEAEARGDSRTAATLDDLTIENCRAALAAWAGVTTLQGDESASVDPALAVSSIAHQLWRATRNPRMGDEQQHNARTLLDTITERHYPQRFEHPVLRLFRIGAAVMLPAYLLAGLLTAVQLPSSVQVRTQTALAFPPPLIDLTRFPNDLIDSRIAAFTADKTLPIDPVKLTRLANSVVQLQPSPPKLDPLGTIKVVLIIMAVYLVIYTVFGLAVIGLSSPAQFQGRRPGRLILYKDRLGWHGPAGMGSLMDALQWVRQDAAALAMRLLRPLAGLFSRALPVEPALRPEINTLPLADIDSAMAVDRRAFGYLLRDLSFTLLKPRDVTRQTITIPGSLVHYEELCDELELRMHHPREPFGVEIIRSGWGICFFLTLLYTLVLATLLPLAPEPLNTPLPWLGYSLINLYILAAPGLLIPLVWWFVAQPLGANSNVSWAVMPLSAAALAGGALTAAVLVDQVTLASIGLRPDLATPVLAIGFLIALVCYAPPWRLRGQSWLNRRAIARVILALAAFTGVLLLAWHITTTLRWYNALVHGNNLVARALAPAGCANGSDGCPLLDQAIDEYSDVICLRPSDGDGYAFRGFAYLVKHNYQLARDDFERALGEVSPTDSCTLGRAPTPSASQRTSLYANLGALDTLLARQPPLANADLHYRDALRSYALALGLPADDAALDCSALALKLLRPGQAASTAAGIDLFSPSASVIQPEQASVTLQLADACFSRGSARVEALATNAGVGRGMDRETARQNAWQDLAAAISEYRAVAAASDDAKDRDLARRGLAAAWLSLSQLARPPVGAPDSKTALLQALAAYQDLAQPGQRDPSVYMGQAWSSLQLGAWDSGKPALATASALAPNDPTYPAFQGLMLWLDSTQYPAPKKGAPSLDYTTAISNALVFYSHVIDMGNANMARAYTTRSLLYFSLRNSPRGAAYVDEDYGAWMTKAISDASQALSEAQRASQQPERQVGYRYWRGRLSFTLALTWQEQSRGAHKWSELVPLYSSAYDDFTAAAAADLNPERRKIFRNIWIPWTRVMLGNASHMQFATEAAQGGDFVRARAELALVEARPSTFAAWDALSAPRPGYDYLHGLIGLGLGLPADFANPLAKRVAGAPATADAEASYTAAISVTEDATFVPQPHGDYHDDARPAIYSAALADLDRLLANPPPGWSVAARAAAMRVRERLVAAGAR